MLDTRWFTIISGVWLCFLGFLSWRQKRDLQSILILVAIIGGSVLLFNCESAYLKGFTTDTVVLSGVVKEKYASTDGGGKYSKAVYKTTIEVAENDDRYIITLDDTNAFNHTIIGNEIAIEKKVTYNKKDNSIVKTKYNYIKK